MDFLCPLKHRNNVINSNSSEQGRAPPELARRRGCFLDVPGKQQQLERTAWGSNNERKPADQGRAPPEVVRRRGSFLDVPGKQQQLERTEWGSNNERKPTKLLLNVNLQNSLGLVQVVMSPENSVRDLIKAVVEIYVRGKRRPLLASSDPRNFKLHYSQFSLEGLKPDEKLKNLGSRNFFVCQETSKALNLSCSEQAKADSPFPLTVLMDFLL